MNFAEETLYGACGVSVLWNFDGDYANFSTKRAWVTAAGCGWVSAGFIEGDKTCNEMFKWMSKQGKLMYKSPVKLNRNSKNNFYFALFDFSNGSDSSDYGFNDADELNN